MKVTISYLNGSMAGCVEEFALPVIRIGRSLTADIILRDEHDAKHRFASRMHAEIKREGDELILYDLGSSNGSYVNNDQVRRYVLKDGDQITFGLGGISIRVNFLLSPQDQTEFLRAARIFVGLPDQIIEEIFNRGNIWSYPAGSYLFRMGDLCNALYIVYSGMVELWSVKDERGTVGVTSYLGSGECIGETLVLVGEKHQSEARVPEAAEMFVLTADEFRELIRTNGEFALHFSTIVCRYLNRGYRTFYPRFLKQLQGNLRYFDLGTIIQTLIGLHETGLLSIYSAGFSIVRSALITTTIGAKPLANLYLESGEVRFVQMGKRSGEEAFYQLFQQPLEGSFSFQPEAMPELLSATTPITVSGLSLLMEAVRLQDELAIIKQRLPDLDTALRILVSNLQWTHPETLHFAEAIWEILHLPSITFGDVLDSAPCCYLSTYRIVLELLDTEQLAIDVGSQTMIFTGK
ncbi:MAG: FHA domain-containing protein [Acidobacteriota bacterium]